MKKVSVEENFIYQMLYEVLVLILPLVTSPYISRVLGASGVGAYSFTYTIANYFVMFAALGIKNYGNREIARNRDNKNDLNFTFSSLLYLHLIVSLIVIVAYTIYIIFFAAEYRLYALTQGFYILGAMFDITWLFNGLEYFKFTVIRNAIIKFITMIAVFVFVKSSDDVWKYILILALGSFLSQIYLWFRVPKLVKLIKVPFSSVIGHLPQLAILFIPTIAISLYNYMDKIMLGSISGTTQLGFYENSEKITSIVFTVVASLGTVMMPRMSNMVAHGDLQRQKKSIDMSMQVVIVLSVAMACGLIGVSSVFPTVFWGEEFAECTILLAFLAIIIPIKAYANVLRTQYLIPNRMDKEYTISVCFGAVFNVVINLILITRIGAMGAVVGTIFAESTVCFIQAVFCRKKLPVIKYFTKNFIYIIFGIAMAISVYSLGIFLGNSLRTLIIQILAGIIFYSGCCFIYFVLTKNSLFLDPIMKVVNRIFKKS